VLDITLEDTKYIGDIVGTRVENISYYITFGKHATKDVGGC
jgi:hypothetical protein